MASIQPYSETLLWVGRVVTTLKDYEICFMKQDIGQTCDVMVAAGEYGGTNGQFPV